MDDWQIAQEAAIAAQKAAHAALANGTVPVPAAADGPLAEYTRAQTLDSLAQLIVVLEDGFHLPNASGPGLTILPGTPRNELTEDDAEDYTETIATLSEVGGYTKREIAEAVARLRANLEAGVTLDPATAEHV
jgi:hypothetical protein